MFVRNSNTLFNYMKSNIWMAAHDLTITAWKHTFNYLNKCSLGAPYGTQIARQFGTFFKALNMGWPRSRGDLSPRLSTRRSDGSSSLLPHAQITWGMADMWHELWNYFQICFAVAVLVAKTENIILNTQSMPMAPRDRQVHFIIKLLYASGF